MFVKYLQGSFKFPSNCIKDKAIYDLYVNIFYLLTIIQLLFNVFATLNFTY